MACPAWRGSVSTNCAAFAGVGASRASRLLAAIEIGRRALWSDARQRPQMLTPEDLAAYLLPRYSGCRVERFGVMLLDQKQRVIRSTILSTGTIESSVSHPRDVFRVAMLGIGVTHRGVP